MWYIICKNAHYNYSLLCIYILVMCPSCSSFQEVKSVFTVLEYELRYGLALANGILENGAYSELKKCLCIGVVLPCCFWNYTTGET